MNFQIRSPVRSRRPKPLHRRHVREYFPDGDARAPRPLHLGQAAKGQNQHANAYPPTHTSPAQTRSAHPWNVTARPDLE